MKLHKLDDHACLEVGNAVLVLKDYKLSTSMHGFTEIEAVIQIEDSVMEFETSTTTEPLQQPN